MKTTGPATFERYTSKKEFFLAFVPTLIAVDPIGILPIFIGLTEGLDSRSRRKTGRDSVVICGRCVYGSLGNVENPDMIEKVADLLLRYEQTDWSLCWGYVVGRLLLSVHSYSGDLRSDQLISKIVSHRGTGGGHRTMAGGQIPLTEDSPSVRKRLDQLIICRFLRATGNDGSPPTQADITQEHVRRSINDGNERQSRSEVPRNWRQRRGCPRQSGRRHRTSWK